MNFRTDLEGLRGVAVLAVVLFHLDLYVAPGGFVGVDVFFVLSGFLITGILYREYKADGRIRLAAFWARRARRILPAATVVLLLTAVAIAWREPRLSVINQAGPLAAASGFVVNWMLALRAVDYLGGAPAAVLQYWSLAVEEQFYLVWPLVLTALLTCFASASMAKRTIVATLILWLMSFGYCLYLSARLPEFAFFDTGSRAFQLLTGALLAVWHDEARPLPSRIAAWIGGAGLAGIVACVALYSRATDYPGWAALVPTLAGGAVIASGSGPAARLLSTPLLRFLGRISYSWYLFHWPFAYFGHTLDGAPLGRRLAALGASLVCGALCYAIVENPLRYAGPLVRSPRMSLAAGAAAILVSLGAATWLWDYGNLRATLSDGRSLSYKQIADDISPVFHDGCLFHPHVVGGKPCVYGAPSGRETVVLFGDSHAAQWSPAIDAAAQSLGWRLLVRTKAACVPHDLVQRSVGIRGSDDDCHIWREAVLAEITAIRPRLAIVAGNSHFKFMLDGRETAVWTSQGRAAAAAAETVLAERLAAIGQSVVFLRDTPIFSVPPLLCLMQHARGEEACRLPLKEVTSGTQFPVAAGSLDPRVRVLDLNVYLCPDETCPAVIDGAPLMHDRSHISASAARTLTPYFVGLMRDAIAPK